jgi:cysteinyl-tRNA synthetase
MSEQLLIYNTLTRQKDAFKPLIPGFVGMYVCGPTVYSDVHLGNCRTFISFDIIYRYLRHLGYKVRYVRNITDAGHLVGDADEGEDKIDRKAKLLGVQPMEIVQHYTVDFHEVMRKLNVLPPSIEPTATGHIIEQIEMTKEIIRNGYAYEVNGTVYFDVEKYDREHPYGQLSNRKLEELLAGSRELEGQGDKKGPLDFALWIKAKPEHLQQWPSPWGMGFPGWHIECSAMSTKYLGPQFDIHGGGMDLIATHHTNEIAQGTACNHAQPANYWIHTNMLSLNGARMSKSKGNYLLPEELFSGIVPDRRPEGEKEKIKWPPISKAYSPMVTRFFVLQTHYSSTLDFSDDALQASEKGFERLMNAVKTLEKLRPSGTSTSDIDGLIKSCYAAMNDDFSTPVLIGHLFEGVRIINSVNAGTETITAEDLDKLKKLMNDFVFNVLGLRHDDDKGNDELLDEVIKVVLDLRQEAKSRKDFPTADKIRNELNKLHIGIKDTKEGVTWTYEN